MGRDNKTNLCKELAEVDVLWEAANLQLEDHHNRRLDQHHLLKM